jgi:outer membrane protein
MLRLSDQITKILAFCALAVATALSPSLATAAGQEVAQIPFVDAPPGTAGLGGGIRFGNINYVTTVDHDQPRDLIPLYLYEGRWLFAYGTAGGIHFIKNDKFAISAVAQYRFQKLDPESDPFYEGLEERRQTLDVGLRAQLTGNWGRLSLQYVADGLDRHNGNETQLSYRYAWHFGSWLLSPYVSWGLQSDNLANYYFGVSEGEARPDLPAYSPGESQFLTYGLNSSYQLNERVLVFANVGFFGSDDSISESPLIEDGRGSSGFVGATYMFGNVFKPTAGDDRVSEWSWRVNYGYQADGNIISEIDQGDFSKSTLVDTNIAGFTLSRLLTDGKRVDFLGKFAVYRHLEEPLQENFNSYNAYIMAMAKGYSPWSGDELFRWGFGFGVSYADQVPMAEQLKQESKGGTTSRFLNYLELQVDFPLRRISKAKWLQNCYAGMTVVHRSGIFGTVDMFSNVAGGADWITASLDCVRR